VPVRNAEDKEGAIVATLARANAIGTLSASWINTRQKGNQANG